MPYIGNTPADKFLTLAKQNFSTSATTSYTLDSAVSSTQDIALFINNVRQSPVDAYSVSGTALTLTSATAGTDEMYCVYLGKTVGTVSPASNSVTTAMLQANAVTAAKFNADVISGQTDIGADIADADLFLVDDGAGGTVRKSVASRLKTYISGGANDPSFHAYNAQNGTVASNTNVIISNNTELFDSSSAYNTSDYKFTPQVAGYYFLYGAVRWQSGDNDFDRINLEILKNGSAILASRNNNTDYSTVNVSGMVSANGSSDYFQLQSYHGKGSDVAITDADEYTFFGGFLVKKS